MQQIINFSKKPILFFICTFGITAIGYLGYRSIIQWQKNKSEKGAAVKIQSAFPRYLAQKQFQNLKLHPEAAVKIQSAFRKHLAQKKYQNLKLHPEAAEKIRNAFRNYKEFCRAKDSEAPQKMWNNSKKAIEEHRQKTDVDPSFYTTVDQGLPSLNEIFTCNPTCSLRFQQFVDEAQGLRSQMEDAQFFYETDDGIITGVLDGHGGPEVANYASHEFEKRFFGELDRAKGNVRRTFELLIHQIHNEVRNRPEWNSIGTTAVISFIDKKTHLIYTATLGDSEANIYRRVGLSFFFKQLKSTPLSCIRHWLSKKDLDRATKNLGEEHIKRYWPAHLRKNPKNIAYPFPQLGINVSRAIGDVEYSGTLEKPAVIHKAKITVNLLKPGDFLVFACDGLKDYVSEAQIIAILKQNHPDPAKELVRYALKERNSTDNVTVRVVKIS